MYPNKLKISSMSSYSLFQSLSSTKFHAPRVKFIFSQQNCKIGPCKNKNSTNVNIQKYVESKIIIQAQIQTLN